MRTRTRASVSGVPTAPVESSRDDKRRALPPAQPGHGARCGDRGRARRGLPRPRVRRAARGAGQGSAAGAQLLAPALGGGEPALLPLVLPAGAEGPQRLPHVRPADGTAGPSGGRGLAGEAMARQDGGESPVSARPAFLRAVGRAAPAAAIAALALGALGIAGCGGSKKVSEEVPKSTPDITPPNDTRAERAAAQATSTTSKTTKSTAREASSSGEESSEGGSEESSSSSSSSSGEGEAGGASSEKEAASGEGGGSKSSAGSSPTGGAGAPAK